MLDNNSYPTTTIWGPVLIFNLSFSILPTTAHPNQDSHIVDNKFKK